MNGIVQYYSQHTCTIYQQQNVSAFIYEYVRAHVYVCLSLNLSAQYDQIEQ